MIADYHALLSNGQNDNAKRLRKDFFGIDDSIKEEEFKKSLNIKFKIKK